MLYIKYQSVKVWKYPTVISEVFYYTYDFLATFRIVLFSSSVNKMTLFLSQQLLLRFRGLSFVVSASYKYTLVSVVRRQTNSDRCRLQWESVYQTIILNPFVPSCLACVRRPPHLTIVGFQRPPPDMDGYLPGCDVVATCSDACSMTLRRPACGKMK